MADEAGNSVGTAYIDVRVRTATMQAGLDAAKSKVSNLGTLAEEQFNRANSSTKRYATSLLRQANTLGKTRAEQIAYNAQLKVGGELGNKIAETALRREASLKRETIALAANNVSVTAGAKSAREMAFAMRTLPAQFTDIATAIGSGQRPLTILLQQGGQIKDMFGGIRPALQAVGSQLLKLVNPYTLVAAAAGALFLAWKGGQDEAIAYNKALALTGGYAGKTAGQLQQMAEQLDGIAGITEHAAAAAIAQVTQTGRFFGGQIETISRAALEMQAATGQAVEKTIQDFERLGDDPVNSVVELNKSMHFLTVATYDQIKALAERGEKDRAAQVAQDAYARAVDRRAKDVRKSLGYLTTGWNDVKQAAKEAWDAMLDVGRPETPQDRIAKLRQQLAQAQAQLANPGSISASSNPVAAARGIDLQSQGLSRSVLQQRVEELREQLRQAEMSELVAPGGNLFAAGQALAKRAAQKLIDKAQAASGTGSGGGGGGGGGSGATRDYSAKLRQMAIDDIRKEVDAQGKLNDAKARALQTDRAYQMQLDAQLQTRKQQIDLQVMAVGMGRQEYQRRSELVQVYGRFDHQLARLNEERDRGSITLDQYNFRLKALKDTEAATVQAVTDGFHRLDRQRADWHAGLLGGLEDVADRYGDAADQMRTFVGGAFDEMADAAGNFVTGTKVSVKSLVASILSDFAKMEARIAASRILLAFFGGATARGFDSNGTFFSMPDANAKGGVFGPSGKITAFANGGVVSSPTLFRHVGGYGLMGEEKPEAIMPLETGPDGKLGVRATGGGGSSVVVHQSFAIDNSGASGNTTTQGQQSDAMRQFQKRMKDVAQQTILDEQRPGGSLWRMAHAS